MDLKVLQGYSYKDFDPKTNDPAVITDDDIIRIATQLTFKWFPVIYQKANMRKDSFTHEDMFQNVVLKALKEKDKFDPKSGAKSTYLFTVINRWFKSYVNACQFPIRNGVKLSADMTIGADNDDGFTFLDGIADQNPRPDQVLSNNELKEKINQAMEMVLANTPNEKVRGFIREYITHYSDYGFHPDATGKKTGDITERFEKECGTTRQNFNEKIKIVYRQMAQILRGMKIVEADAE